MVGGALGLGPSRSRLEFGECSRPHSHDGPLVLLRTLTCLARFACSAMLAGMLILMQ